MDSYNRGRRPPPPQTGARALPLLPPPPSPQGGGGGGGVNQSCLTAPLSVWSYDTCQVKKVNAIHERVASEWHQSGIRVASEWHEGGMAWHGVAWHGMEWHGMASFILDI